MKLIIDVPEEDYNHAKQQVADGITNPLKIFIASGIPIPDNATKRDLVNNAPTVDVLEQIRAEIEHEGAMFPDGEFFVSIDRINEIIDKYTDRKEQII